MKRKGEDKMRWFKKPIIPIKTALSVSYVAVFLLFFAVVGSIMFYTSERMVTDNTKQLAHQEVEEVQQTMNTYLSEMKTLASSLAYNPNILEYVKTVSDMEGGEVNWKQQLNRVITGSLMKEKGMHSIGVFPIGESEGIYFGDTSMQSVYQTEKMYPQYDILETTGGECIWIPKFPLKYSTHQLTSLQYRIVDVNTFQELGVLVVNLKTLYLNNILSKYGMAGHLCLVDETGNVIAQNKSGESPVDEIVGELYQSDANDMVRTIDGVKYVVSFDTLSVTNWKMVGLIPIQSLQDNVRHGQMLMTLSMIVGAVIVITLSLIIASKISKPIAKLTEGMKAVQNDRLDIRIEDHTFLETKWLSEGFNGMLDDINELLIKSYQQELMERDIRLEALQAKISPHFLYNTLETINALLILDENYETSKLVSSLADLLRYSISDSNRIVTIETELEYIRNYLYIHKTRFGDQFEYTIEVEEEARHGRIMKMLIQPIVENAVIHGIENKIGAGRVEIRAWTENESVRISVSDNGAGMSQEKIEEVLKVDQSCAKQTERRIGVQNVLSRIRLHYGPPYGLSIQSRIGEGTTVMLTVPKTEQEEKLEK